MWRCKDCGKIFDEPDAHECCGVFKEDTKFEQVEEHKVVERNTIPWKYGNKASQSGVYLVCSQSENCVKFDITDLNGHFMSADPYIYAYVNIQDISMPPWEQISTQE